jgi:hypothetical protein
VPSIAKLEELLAAIENPRLCEQLIREGRDLNDRTRFGLVYERHVGGASAGVGYLIGTLGPSLFGAG